MRAVLGCVVLSLTTASLADTKSPTPERNAEETAKAVRSLEPKLKKNLADAGVPGAALVVIKDDKVVYSKGFGYRNLERKLLFTPDTLCHIASTSKAFCGVTLLMAQADGLLRLDESPKRLLPDFKMRDPEADQGMTIADLMSHSSGLPRTDMGWGPGVIDAKEATRLLGEAEPTLPFRYMGQYSNMMVETAGRAVAAAYGKPWGEVVSEKITKPLGLTSTKLFTVPPAEPDRAATGYYRTRSGQVLPDRMTQYNALAAAGGLESNANDLATWIRFHLSDGAVDGKRLVPASLMEEDHRAPFSYAGFETYGLGWFRDTLRPEVVIQHGGSLAGFSTMIVLVPSKHLGFALLTNVGGSFALNESDEILDRLVGKPDLVETTKVRNLEGRYWTADGGHVMQLEAIDTELWMTLDCARMVRLFKTGDMTWSAKDPHDPKIELVARTDPRSHETHITITTAGVPSEFASKATNYHCDTTPEALYRRVAEATGSKLASAGKILECRFTSRYASEALDSVGLLYRAPTHRFADFESIWDGNRRSMLDLTAIRPGALDEARDCSRLSQNSGPPHLDSMAGYCNEFGGRPRDAKVEIVGEVMWKGEAAYAVQTKWEDGADRLDYISKSRALPLRREMAGGWTETYEDYQMVEGTAVPMRLTLRDKNFSENHIVVSKARFIDREPHWAFYPSAWP